MAENVLEQLKGTLQELSSLLDQDAIKNAISLIPDAIMNPVIDGLKTILNVIKDALNELKQSLDSVVNIEQLLSTINNLLEAAEGLAPGQKDTLESVRSIVKTLQDLPGIQDIEEILSLIDQIITKLEAL